MPFAMFWGCKTGYYQRPYKKATGAVVRALGIKAVELEFGCCGYPARDIYFDAYIYTAARNIALAGHEGLDLLTPCKCCFGNLKSADFYLREDEALREKVNQRLGEEGLVWDGQTAIRHILSVLDQDVGAEALGERVSSSLNGLRVAAHYGCQALRPSRITEFDNPLNPTLFERLIQSSGAEAVDWGKRLECCGNPVMYKNPELSVKQLKTKTDSAREAGADLLCVACNCCLMQFNVLQRQAVDSGLVQEMPVIGATQLIGLGLGLPRKELGLESGGSLLC